MIKPLILLAALSLSGCASLSEHATGITPDGDLQACPQAPRCVSSQQARDGRLVAPLVMVRADDNIWQQLIALLGQQERTEVVEQTAGYARAEVASPWGVYTDDVELLRRVDGVTVDIRSTGRIGWYDFSVNADRVDQLREAWVAAGLIKP